MGESSEIWRVGRSRRGGSDGDGGDGSLTFIPRNVALYLGGCHVSDESWEIWAARTRGSKGYGQVTKSDSHSRWTDESDPVTCQAVPHQVSETS
jgi:hypothetical protein